MTQYCKSIRDSQRFDYFIMAVIIFAGIVVGLQTDKGIVTTYGAVLESIDKIILAIFVIEASIKIVAEGSRPWLYFKSGWNIFDFSIVAFSLFEVVIQSGAGFAAVLRLFRLARLMRIFRVMRVFRVVTAFQELQFLVETILKSFTSISYVGVLLLLLFYIYGTMGIFLFRDNDPIHFGNLSIAMISLFQIITLDNWINHLYTNMYGCAFYGYEGVESFCTTPDPAPITTVIYFISFILFGTMIVMNLFIGVIMDSMEKVKDERELEGLTDDSIPEQIKLLKNTLAEMTNDLNTIEQLFQKEVKSRKPKKIN